MRRYQNQRISARKATQKHGFRTEIQNELVREPRTKFLHFRVRKALQTLQFLVEIACRVCISARKRRKLRPFHLKKLGPEVMASSLPGGGRDLADPLAFEPLNQPSRIPILYMMYDSDIVTGRSRTVQDDFEKLEGQLRRPTCSIDINIHVWAVPARC